MMIYAVRTGFEPVEANKAPQLFSRESLSTTQAPDQERLYWDGMCNYTKPSQQGGTYRRQNDLGALQWTIHHPSQ